MRKPTEVDEKFIEGWAKKLISKKYIDFNDAKEGIRDAKEGIRQLLAEAGVKVKEASDDK